MNYTPAYLKSPIPLPRTHLFGVRFEKVIPLINCKTNRYRSSCYPDSIIRWNGIGSELRNLAPLSLFKVNIFKLVRPNKRIIFGLHNPIGVKRLFQLRVGLSPLKFHKKKYNFLDTPSDACDCSGLPETLNHYFFHCSNHVDPRKFLMDSITPILREFNLLSLQESSMLKLLLYGHITITQAENLAILTAT